MSPSRAHAAPGRALRLALAVVLASAAAATAARAQDRTFVLPILEIEEHLRDRPFEIIDWRGSRAVEDRTQRAVLQFHDGPVLAAKFAVAPPGGRAFNNEPRYEVAAYEIQKLFLDPHDYVVPPTVLRAFPVDFATARLRSGVRTFRGAESILVVLQYWLPDMTPEGFWDPDRARQDAVYARHIGNLNILTYLIRHGDSNTGNFLITRWEEKTPRVFSVDNGIAFRSQVSDRGHAWRELRVRRVPAATIDRLRSLTVDDFHRALGVLAEYGIEGGRLVPVLPGENLAPGRGVRIRDDRVQLGLTTGEIREVDQRRQALLRRVARGRIDVF
jgi:hypothetical protein